ncbi:MAG: hypothetical protein C0485_02115 [Pirellula sp.]|nr:hypothetical protein [Pirellula sp.]
MTFSLLALILSGCGETEKGPPPAAQLFLEAQQAIAKGDPTAALTALQASIDADPNEYSYMERIKINGKQGNDAAVEADVQEILKLNSKNRDIDWIRAEMKKPAAARFDGSTTPPSARK